MTLPTEQKLFSRVSPEPNSGCWLWTGPISNSGYGSWGGRLVHRLSYEIFNGPIAQKKVVRHKCDVKLCANPNHLVIGLQLDNVNDHIERAGHWRKRNTHCKRGHLYQNQALRGPRICWACKLINAEKTRSRKNQGLHLQPTCSVTDCTNPVWIPSRKLCRAHYKKWWRQNKEN